MENKQKPVERETRQLIQTYNVLLKSQIYAYFAKTQRDHFVGRTFKTLEKEKQIYIHQDLEMAAINEEAFKARNVGTLQAFWVLLDIMDQKEVDQHFLASKEEYPVRIVLCGEGEERYISLRCKDGYRGYVLLEKGRNYLLSEYEKELSFFISGSGQTGHVKSEPEKRMRLYRMSEVWVFFWKAGIEILRNHKPDMDKGFVRDRGKAFYYGSLEFKGMSEAIRGSRSCGVLLSGDTALVVYNTMDRNMKWAKKMECSMRTWTERMLLKGGYNSRADALIVGQNIKVLLKLLESDGGIKKDLFRPDDIYDQYYYIPMCQEGILQIILLTEKQKREKLKQFLLSRFPIRKEKEYAVYAVCDEIGNPVYLGYDLEMRQLCRIKQELLWRPSVSIVCMDYQAEIIREYLGEKVIIYELNTENVMKYLINDIGE